MVNDEFVSSFTIFVYFFFYSFLPDMAEYFNIGKFVAAHGLKGELILQHRLGKKSSLKGLKTLFTEERKDSFLPWFIESTRIKNETEIYIKLESVDTREAATKITQKEIWLTEEDFKKFAAKSSPMGLLGYHLYNQNRDLGPILEVIEQPHQIICRLELNQKEILAPIHENTLQKIDHKKRIVYVEFPEGLLELYLGAG